MGERQGDKAASGGGGRALIGVEAMIAFLRGLRGGLEVAAAAAAVGFSEDGFRNVRRRNALFRIAWDLAMELAALEQRAEAQAARAGEGGLDAERGDCIRPNNRRRLQVRRMRRLRFTPARKRVFLAYFEATCDFDAAAAAAGVDRTTVYGHRREDADFAAACQAALETGYQNLEGEALRQRLAAQKKLKEAEAEGWGQVPPEAASEFERVLKLLQRWDRKGGKVGFRTPTPGRMRRWSFEEAMALLVKKLKAIDAAPRLPPPADGDSHQ